ncbi:hypothetical protein, partial [Nonomuraea recticatena]|uniref:hypothetical protein n=1 Tax=Nonomuraea recticatena TaxID=46178 RepID=UPI0031FA29CD
MTAADVAPVVVPESLSRLPGGFGAPGSRTYEVFRMSDAFIICSNLSFSWPDDTPVFSDLSF